MSPAALRSQLTEFRRQHSLPALGGGTVGGHGRVDVDVVGMRIRDGELAVELGDRWHIGSCGKSITAALYARLVERGLADWGMPLAELFPDLADRIHAGWGRVTIDDVFVSQAGLPANLGKTEILAASRDTRPLREQRTEAAAAALARPPRRPGSFLYSNLGYIVIGAAIERITDRSYESALGAHVLEPLGISSGGFGPPPEIWGHGGRLRQLGPLGFVDLGAGRPADPERVESDNPPIMSPAGRLHLSLGDWAKLQRVFVSGGGGFLRPETVDRLLTPARGRGYRQAFGWAPVRGLAGASLGQHGSNTFWVATAMIDVGRERAALVVCNAGRASVLKRAPHFAVRLLGAAG